MDSHVGETESCTTTFIPRWDATLVWDIEDEALCFLEGSKKRAVSSGVTVMAQKALRKSISWSISLSPGVGPHNKNVYMALYLSGESVSSIHYCLFEVFLQGAESESSNCLTGDAQKLQPQYAEIAHSANSFGYSSYRRHECSVPVGSIIGHRNGGAPQGTVRISVKLRIVFQEENRPGPRVLLVANKLTPSGERWITSLFNKEMYSDVIITCGLKTFYAHKMVLGQNPVLAKMFSTPMREAHSHKVTISDTDTTNFECFLKSLYGVPYELPTAVGKILDLINCAEKYGIMDIKAACFQKLVGMLSDENAAKLNIAAYRFCDNTEMRAFRDFFKSYCQERHNILVKNPEYRRLVKENFDAFM